MFPELSTIMAAKVVEAMEKSRKRKRALRL
jgi:hypothetical protein